MPLLTSLAAEKRKKLLAGLGALVFVVLITLGIFAKNGWLPSTDPLSGKKVLSEPPAVAGGLTRANLTTAAPLPSPTPQLSKEYIYAGSRLLAVEDANANAAPPADLAIWRLSTGVWCVMGSTGSTETYYQWGAEDDDAVPGDFDGDGKTDFSVFRPSDGVWYIVNSSNGSQGGWQFGQNGDTPAAADFDGDGKTDSAIYRENPSTGNADWYIRKSSDQTMIVSQWGLPTDIPAAADYDGDGKADIAVYRSSESTFYVLRSSDGNLFGFDFPESSTEPVSADYDGDGKADFAIRSGNNWIIHKSSTGQTDDPVTWYLGTDTAVQNDYDGDGKVDIAVWKNAGGWYIRQSSKVGQPGVLRTEQFGQTDDIPVPAFYRR